MDKQLQEFFYDEIDRRYLDFETFPEYNDLFSQCLALFPSGDLPDEIARLLDLSNCISFAHGLRQGLKLKRWANRPLRKRGSTRRPARRSYTSSSFSSASRARRESSAFLFRLPFTR